jgi:TolA-binding protein
MRLRTDIASFAFVLATSGAVRAFAGKEAPLNDVMNDLSVETQDMQRESKAYENEVDMRMEMEMTGIRGRTNKVFEHDLKELSTNEEGDRQKLYQSLKDLYAKLPEVPEKPDILLKLQILSFEITTDKYFKEEEKYDEDMKLFVAGKLPAQPAAPKKDYTDTINYGTTLVKLYPKFEQVDKSLYLLSYSYTDLGQDSKAAPYFFQIITQHPNSQYFVESNLRIAEYYFKEEMYAQALPYYEIVRTSSKEEYYEKVLYKTAWTYFKLNQYFRSADTFFQLLQYIRENPSVGGDTVAKEARFFVAAMFAEAGGIKMAQEYFKDRPYRDAEYDIYSLIGDYQNERADFKQAYEVYAWLIKTYPLDYRNAQNHQKMISILLKIDKNDGYQRAISNFITSYDQGTPWYQAQGTHPEAQALALTAVDSYAYKRVLYLHQIAQSTKTPKDYWNAANAYREYIYKYPGSEHADEANFRYATTLYFSGKYDWAGIEYQYILDHSRNAEFLDQSLHGLIKAYENQTFAMRAYARSPAGGMEALVDPTGKPRPQRELLPQEAKLVVLLRKYAGSAGPEKGRVLSTYKQGEIFFRNNQFSRSRPIFTEVVEKYPKDPLAIEAAKMNLESYRLEGNWDEVEKWSKKLLALNKTDRKIASDVSKLLSGSLFKKAEELDARGKTDEAVQEYRRLAKELPNSADAPKALFNASVLSDRVGKTDAAISDLDTMVKKYPKNPLAASGLFQKAVLEDAVFNVVAAKGSLTKLVREHPEAKETPDGLYRLALMAESQQNYAEAGYYFEEYARHKHYKEDARKALIDSAEAYRKGGRVKDALRVEDTYAKQFPRDVDKHIEFLGKKYEMALGTNPKAAAYYADEATKIYAKNKGQEFSADSRRMVAKMHYDQSTPLMKRYLATHLQLPQKKLAQTLKLKGEMQKALDQRLTHVIEIGDPEYATYALLRMGEVYDDFANEFYHPPIPRGLKGEEVDLYKAELQKQAYPIEDKAATSYQKAVENAVKYRLSAQVINHAKKKLTKYQPNTVLDPVDWSDNVEVSMASYTPLPPLPKEGPAP